MRVKHKSRNLEYRYFKISLLIVIILTILFGIIPAIASANPVPIYYIGWDVGGNILLLFFANLILDGLILMIPLVILSKLGYEKRISELWIFGLPLIAIWGAYIDAIYIKINLSIEISSFSLILIVFIISVIMIFITFLVTISFIMGHRIRTGITIGIIAIIINAIFWAFINFENINNYPIAPRVLTYSGVLAFIFLIFLMLGYFIRKANHKKYYDSISVPNNEVDNSILKASTSILHTFFLLFLAFLMALFLV